jgi:arabinose-5-phosphate isomerase
MSDALAVGRRVLQAEAEALALLSDSLDGPFTQAVELVGALKGRLALTGIGKSGHVARKIAATLASTGTPALYVHPAEASHGDLGMIGPGDAVLALSKSGETRELADVVGHAKRFGLPLIAMTARPDSALGRAADLVLRLPDAAEATEAVDAPTTSTTLQMALGDALAVAVMERRGFGAREFGAFHPGGTLGAALKPVDALMHAGAELPLAPPETPMAEALLLMTEKRFGCIGVCDASGLLVGIVTDGDLRRHMDGLLERTAGEIMTRAPKTVPSGALAAEAIKLMSDPPPAVTALFVVEAGKPIGILHVHDLLRAGVG